MQGVLSRLPSRPAARHPRFIRCRCTPCTDTEVGAQRPHPLPRCVSECYTLAHLIPRYPPHVHTGTWGTLETFTPAVRANKVCTDRPSRETQPPALMPPAKKTSSVQNATLQSMGMDVIKQYPGPLTVSRAVKVDVPGKVALPAAHRRGAPERVVRGHGRRVHGEVRQRLRPLGCTVLQLAEPLSSSDALPLRLRHPRARPGRRPTLRRPAP